MTTALATDAARRAGPTPFALDGADRLEALFAPMRGMSRAALAVLGGSVALHLVLVATAIVTSRAPPVFPAPQETAVEVVQEVPKEAPKESPKPPPIQKAEAPKLESPKVDALKPEPVRPPPPRQTAQAAPPKTTAPKVEAPKVEAPKPEAPKPASVKDVSEEREALLKELAALRAQESKLEARETPTTGNLGMGPLPDSFQAVALPSSNEAAGEAMGFKEIVFSQLAKAKGLDERMGLPGTAGVRFEIDAAGRLVAAEIVRPSGVAALDREALDIVRRAAPFPVPPQGAQRSFVANVSFVSQGDQGGKR